MTEKLDRLAALLPRVKAKLNAACYIDRENGEQRAYWVSLLTDDAHLLVEAGEELLEVLLAFDDEPDGT